MSDKHYIFTVQKKSQGPGDLKSAREKLQKINQQIGHYNIEDRDYFQRSQFDVNGMRWDVEWLQIQECTNEPRKGVEFGNMSVKIAMKRCCVGFVDFLLKM